MHLSSSSSSSFPSPKSLKLRSPHLPSFLPSCLPARFTRDMSRHFLGDHLVSRSFAPSFVYPTPPQRCSADSTSTGLFKVSFLLWMSGVDPSPSHGGRKPRSPYSTKLTSQPAANSRSLPYLTRMTDREPPPSHRAEFLRISCKFVGKKLSPFGVGKEVREDGRAPSLWLLHSIIHTFCGRHSGVRVGPAEWRTRGGRGGGFNAAGT